MLKIPGDAFSTKVPFLPDHLRRACFGCRLQPQATHSRRCTFGHTRKAMALAHALNRARTWGIRSQLLADLVGTQGRMTLTERHHTPLAVRIETIVRPLRAARTIS